MSHVDLSKYYVFEQLVSRKLDESRLIDWSVTNFMKTHQSLDLLCDFIL